MILHRRENAVFCIPYINIGLEQDTVTLSPL
jgi:hypothetical protein